MFRQILTWRTLLAVVAILIVSGTIWYSSYLAKKIEHEERRKVEEWVEASKALLDTTTTNIALPFKIIQDNTDIPIISTNEQDSILEYYNLDSNKVKANTNFLKTSLQKFKSENPPIIYHDPLVASHINRYYYGHTQLLREVRYYPLAQLLIVSLFIVVMILLLRSSYQSSQNGVWAGMAKETAHQ